MGGPPRYSAERGGDQAALVFRAALRAGIERAVDDVALSHPHDSDVPAGRPIPRWSWAGA